MCCRNWFGFFNIKRNLSFRNSWYCLVKVDGEKDLEGVLEKLDRLVKKKGVRDGEVKSKKKKEGGGGKLLRVRLG